MQQIDSQIFHWQRCQVFSWTCSKSVLISISYRNLIFEMAFVSITNYKCSLDHYKYNSWTDYYKGANWWSSWHTDEKYVVRFRIQTCYDQHIALLSNKQPLSNDMSRFPWSCGWHAGSFSLNGWTLDEDWTLGPRNLRWGPRDWSQFSLSHGSWKGGCTIFLETISMSNFKLGFSSQT